MNNNSITITGNLTREPEYRVNERGNGYTRGGVAFNRSRKVGDEWEEETSFFDFVVLDDQMAQNVSELPSGARVTITGWLQSRSVKQEDETNRTFTTIVAEDVSASLRWATVAIHKNEKRESASVGAGSAAKSGDFFDDF